LFKCGQPQDAGRSYSLLQKHAVSSAHMSAPLHVVWFKRDLRIQDHRPLVDAARRGPVLPLFVIEPDFWQQPDAAARHWLFVAESLRELVSELGRLGQPLVVRLGDMVDVLESIRRSH
jgi:deoxyribodipyrimidine photo-lyase